MISAGVKNKIQNEVQAEIIEITSVSGGDINKAAKLKLDSGESVFVKWNDLAPKTMFEAEAKGLQLLRSAGTDLKIPEVKLVADDFLLLEWIPEGGDRQESAFKFGTELAKLHQKTSSTFGLNHDNFIGRLLQSNNQHAYWADFFAIERIEPQIKMGVESGKLTRSVLKSVESLYKKLGHIFPNEKPALIHGDLWSGNYMFTKSGDTCIYDPAIYYGHREMELAMTRLFGGFSANFYNGYEQEFPLEPGFKERVTVYNLYPILVHANLFGGSYSRQAKDIIARFS